MTKSPKYNLKHLNRLLKQEVDYMESTLRYLRGPTGSDQKGPICDIPYVQLASVNRQISIRKKLSRIGKEISKRKKND
jgi:hypothetical protein